MAERKGILVFDIEEVKRSLESILSSIEKRRLSKVLDLKDVSLEDLVIYVCKKLTLTFKDVKEITVKASVPNGSVEVTCNNSP